MKNKQAILDYISSLLYDNEKEIKELLSRNGKRYYQLKENDVLFKVGLETQCYYALGSIIIKYKQIEKIYYLKEIKNILNGFKKDIENERIRRIEKENNELSIILMTGSNKKIKQKEKMIKILDKELGLTA
jgi:hypothetical protein